MQLMQRISRVLICSGWGVPSSALLPLTNALAMMFSQHNQSVTVHCVSSTEDENWDVLLQPSLVRETLAIGYSMGFSCLIQHLQARQLTCAALVSLAGFTRFCAQDVGQSGTPTRVIKRMIAQFEQEPKQVWQAFLNNANIALNDALMATVMQHDGWPMRLALGLKNLATLDITDNWKTFSAGVPWLALASSDDMIVSAELTKSLFNKVVWFSQAGVHQVGHGLPIAQADWCAATIVAWLNTFNEDQRYG